MKNILIVIVLGIMIVSSCEKTDLNIDAPTCIKDKIETIKNNKVSNPPTQVWKWEASKKTYYYITSDCCDQYNNLFDKQCKIVCAPDGGITGNGDGNCPVFNSEINKTLVWEDKRN